MRTLLTLAIAMLINALALSTSASADLIPPDQDESSISPPPASDYYERYPELLEREQPTKSSSGCARGGGAAGLVSIAIGLTLLALSRRRDGDDSDLDALSIS